MHPSSLEALVAKQKLSYFGRIMLRKDGMQIEAQPEEEDTQELDDGRSERSDAAMIPRTTRSSA